MWGGGYGCWGGWGEAARGRLVGWAVTEEAARRMGSAGRVGWRAGPASLEGLVWLGRGGPASVEAGGWAVGWGGSGGVSRGSALLQSRRGVARWAGVARWGSRTRSG